MTLSFKETARVLRALERRGKTGAAWRGMRQRIAALSDPELKAAEEYERMTKRRTEIFKALSAEKRKRAGRRLGRDGEPVRVEAHL